MEISEETLLGVTERAFKDGQLNGIILSCEVLIKSINDFKEQCMKELSDKNASRDAVN